MYSHLVACASATTVQDACAGLVADLYPRWDRPSVYLLVDGRLRCQAAAGSFRVSDGFFPTTGVVARAVSTGTTQVVDDGPVGAADVAGLPGLRATVCVPVLVDGAVVGAVNLESGSELDEADLDDARIAGALLGARLAELGGLPRASPAEQLARVAISIISQTEEHLIRSTAVDGARDLSGMATAALAQITATGWEITCARGPLAGAICSWQPADLAVLGGAGLAGGSSYFPGGADLPAGFEFLGRGVRALAVQPLAVAGEVIGLLITADRHPVGHDPALTSAMELLAAQTAAMLAMASTVSGLAHQATHDPLTGLRNRRALVDALEHDLIEQVQGSALVLLDLDGFKSVNDTFGHGEGDALLTAVGRRLVAMARRGDVVARLGGDEFAVLVRGLRPQEGVLAVAARLVRAATAGTDTSRHAEVGASAGVRAVSGAGPSEILRDADAALYRAKRAGRGRAVLWNLALDREDQDQQQLVEELRIALSREELHLVYQPVVEIATGRVLGMEALARWDHPERGPVSPVEFVTAAEGSGQVGDLTRWVLRTACGAALDWTDAGVNLAVNISAAQLMDDQVVADVETALAASGLPANRLVLEVTETLPMQDLNRAKATLENLAALWVVLALDDFGTGYSSLTHAHALPFHILKIDRSFVAGAAAGNLAALATISAVTALASRLDVDVVAEGVEDLTQLPALAELGCTYAQGFALARPMPAAEVSRHLADGPWQLGVRTQPRVEPATPPPRRGGTGASVQVEPVVSPA